MGSATRVWAFHEGCARPREKRALRRAGLLQRSSHADVLTETASGDLVLDVRRFHDRVGTEATEGFPYAWRAPTGPG